MTCIGRKSSKIYETFNFDDPGDEMKLEPVLERFSEYCSPWNNITILCQKFSTYEQHEEQNSHDFVTELKKLQTACGINGISLRERLLQESELTLPKAIFAGQAAEETCEHACKILKGELIQIWKSPYMFLFIRNQ